MSQAGGNIGSVSIDFIGNLAQLQEAAARAKILTEDAVAKAQAASLAKSRGSGAQAMFEANRAMAAATQAASAHAAALQKQVEATIALENRTAIYAARIQQQTAIQDANTLSTKQQIGAVTGFIGRLGAVAGVATLFFGIGRAIREGVITALESGKKKADEFKESLDFRDIGGSAEALQKELDSINSKIAANSQSAVGRITNFFTGDTTKKLKERQGEIQAALTTARRNIRGQEDRDRRAKEAKEKAASEASLATAKAEYDARSSIIEDAVAREEDASLSGEDKIRREATRKLDELDKLREGASGSQLKRIDEASKLVLKNLGIELSAFRDAEEAKRKEIDKTAIAMSRAIEDVRRQAAASFNPNQFESGLESIIQKMDIIVSQLGRGT